MKLEIKNLSKQYGNKVALDDLNLTLQCGIYGILGENGAGKSTLMNLITDNIKRDGGEILFQGKDILTYGDSFRSLVGYMCQQQGEFPDFSAYTFLMYMAELKGLHKKEARKQSLELLEKLNLHEVADKRVNGFSGGMKQRVMLAQALLGNPRILLLDEPTAGLDPRERIRIRNLISELSKNKIILLATHVVSDVACIADEILLMKEGELVISGTATELIDSIQDKVWERNCCKEDLAGLQKKYPAGNVEQRREGLVFRVVGDKAELPFVQVHGNADLEDVYLYYLSTDIVKNRGKYND